MTNESTPSVAREQSGQEWSDEALRIAIAQVCGWKPQPEIQSPESLWDDVAIAKMMNDPSYLPDYPSDLNAMHEAEKLLTDKQRIDYAWSLAEVASRRIVSATARQRCLAFVKTLGLYPDVRSTSGVSVPANADSSAESAPNNSARRAE